MVRKMGENSDKPAAVSGHDREKEKGRKECRQLNYRYIFLLTLQEPGPKTTPLKYLPLFTRPPMIFRARTKGRSKNSRT